MSKANPRKAIAALIPPGQAVIKPMTLGMWAALERINSPLVTGREPKDTLELIPSLYLLTHDPREVFRGNILDLAMQWADQEPVDVVERIKEAAYKQMGAFFDVVPEVDDSKKKVPKQATAGSRSSSTTSPAPTTGRSKKSSGKRQYQRLHSSAGKVAKTKTDHSTSSRYRK